MLGVVLCSLLLAGDARASDWMYRRSYFSHELADGVEVPYPRPESRSAYRQAYLWPGPGIAVRGGYRFNRVFLGTGPSLDITVTTEGWINIQP